MMKRVIAPMIVAAGLLAPMVLHAQDIELRAITGLPSNNPLNARLADFVDLVNEQGEGVVSISLAGGPEVIPPQQQDTALRNGVIDMIVAPTSYYAGSVPEGNAVKGSNLSPVELRANGGYERLDQIWREKINGVFVGNITSGVQYHLYLTNPPVFTDDGRIDLTGVTMRSTPAYNSWFESLGASNVVLQASEIFQGLERGIVEGLAWPSIGVTDLGVQEFVRYRVDPGVWQVDIIIVVNQDKWNALTDEARSVIREAAAEIEAGNDAFFAAALKRENAILEEAGVTLLELEGDQRNRHVDVANAVVWEELEAQAPENSAALKELLFRE